MLGIMNAAHDDRRCSRIWQPLLAIIIAVLAYVSVTISYTEGSVFASWQQTLPDWGKYIGMAGAGGSTALFLCLLAAVALSARLFVRAEGRVRWWSAGCGAVLALTLTFTPYLDSTAAYDQSAVGYTPPDVADEFRTKWYYLYLLVKFSGYALLLGLLTCALFTVILSRGRLRDPLLSDGMRAWWDERSRAVSALFAPLSRRVAAFGWRGSLTVGAIILVCWTPWIYMLSPTNIGPDTVAQLVWARTGQAWDPSSREYLPGYAMSDQHPWFDTVLYGSFDSFGRAIGNVPFVLWLLAFLHAVLIALALGVMLNYMAGVLRVPGGWCVAAMFFYALVPAFGRLSVTVVKDLTCMPFFILWIVMFVEYVRRIRASKRIGAWFLLGFLALAVMCSLTRRLSLYIIAFTLLCCALVLRRRVLSALYAVVLVAVMTIIPHVALPALRVAPTGSQETLAIPLQQTVHVLLAKGDSLSEEDRAAITAMFSCSTDQLAERYTAGGSDPVKDCFNRNATSAQKRTFLLTWGKLGVPPPLHGSYLNAVQWWRDSFTMGTVYDEQFQVWWGWEDKGGDMIFPEYQTHERSVPQKYGAALYQALSKLPVLGLFMSEATYVVWFPVLAVALCFLRGRKWNLMVLVPFALTIATLFVDPAHQSRYTWTLLFCSMLIAAAPFMKLGEREHRAS